MFKFRDILSFEAVYVCFLYGGILKGVPAIQRATHNIDLTLLAVLVGIYLAIGMCLTYRLPIHPKTPQYFLIYVLFVCWAAISYSAYGSGEYAQRKIGKLLLMTSWAVLAPLLIVSSSERIRRFLNLLVAMAMVMALFGIIEDPPIPTQQVGAFGTENYQPVGRTCGMGIVILLTLLAYDDNRAHRLVYGFVLASLMATLFLSGARQALAGLFVALIPLPIAIWFAAGRRISLRRYVTGILFLVLLIAVAGMTIMSQIKNTQAADRMVKAVKIGQEGGLNPGEENRPQLLRRAWRLWCKYPVCGAGYGGYAVFSNSEGEPEIRWPHNMVLEILCELGLVGLVFILLLLGIPFVIWIKECTRKDNYIAVALGSAWLFELTCAMVSWDMNDNRMVFALASMIVANAGFRKTLDSEV